MSAHDKQLRKISQLSPTIQPIVLAALISKLFREYAVELTVVGDATVQFYTQAEYVTKDLDAILFGDTKEINEAVMGKLGFARTTTYRHFENPMFDFVVEFPPAPIQVGSRFINQVQVIETELGPARLVRLEDILIDRIAAAVEWKDIPSLEQAKLLWLKNRDVIDQKYLKKFAKEEGYTETLKTVMASAPARKKRKKTP